MACITGELRLEELDDWFKIGLKTGEKKEQRRQAIVTSSLGGRLYDPKTGGVYQRDVQKDLEKQLPKYLRLGLRAGEGFDGQKYVEQYKKQEELELLSHYRGSTDDGDNESVVNDLDALELNSTVPGRSIAVPEDLIPEKATDVYFNYNLQHSYGDLPVLNAREEIVNVIEAHQVTIIQGPTGSGKTTQVPQFIFDHYASESKYCNIVITQPRKIAAVSIAQRVCAERGWPIGSLCGYQIGLDRKSTEDTRILYCTTGVLKEKLILKKNMHDYTHVILDEVHERDIETDFLLLIVKKLLRTNSSHVKIILMSATFDTDIFADYFALPVGNHLEKAPVVNVDSGRHTVSEFYADDLTSRLGPLPPIDEAQPGIHSAMYDMAIELVKHFDLIEEKEQGKDQSTGFAPVRGTVLMFLPGYYEITNMLEKVRPLEETYFVIPIPLHSSITLDEQNKAFMKPAKGFRKIIISTNIAESSITVPDIKYVIDFCLTKTLCCHPESNYPQLHLEWASKANAKQRKGRAGRVSHGRVYYMVPRWFFDRVLPEYGIPEMKRSPLESLVLKSKIFNMGEPKAVLALALSPPNLSDIERTILNLKEVGALCSFVGETCNPHDGDLTFIGRVLAELPVDIRIGKLLVLGHVFGVLEECLIIGAALTVKSIFANPLQSRLEAYKAKLSWSDNSHSDCLAIINAYKVWENRVKMKEFSRTGMTEKQWGRKNFIQIQAIKEVHKLVQELEQRLKKFNIVKPTQPPPFKGSHTSAVERLILKLVLCGAFYPNYALKEEVDEKEAVKLLSNNDPTRTVMVKNLPINQGILYEQQMRDLFSCCQKDPPPSLSSEQTKAFIEFHWKSGSVSEGRIHPAVYAAIKLRQLNIKLPITLFGREETKSCLQELQKAASAQRASSDLRSCRLKVDSNSGETSQSCNTVKIDPETSTLLLSVTEVKECGHFWAQCDNVHNVALLTEIQSALNGPHSFLKPVSGMLKPGVLVAAPYDDESPLYYRGRVEEINTMKVPVAGAMAKSSLVAKVFFVDYGNTELIEVGMLRDLPATCLNKPYMALEFYLKGIRPSSVKCPDNSWSPQANALFKSWTLNKLLFAQVYSVVNNTVRVELVAKYNNGQEVCFNDELINQGFAVAAEESFLSQQNHTWRQNCLTDDTLASQPDSWVQVSLPSQTSKRQKGRKVYLAGPYSPLEMSFSGMTFSGRLMSVRVDPESVNSVAIDENPQEKFSRLLVSSSTGLNPAGNSLIARQTTLLPQIPGLASFITLVFTPYAEFRTDPKCQRYIGAVCGLGYDDENLSVLPDHDIELTFETEFTTEDIVMINEVRMAINIALGTEDTMATFGQDVFVRIQEKAREKILMLLKKQREPVQPDNFIKPYTWNLIPPELVLHHDLTDTEADSDHLLKLHNAISLSCDSRTTEKDTSVSSQKKEYYVKHLAYLEKISKSNKREPILCELCKVQTASSHILAIHLLTERHLKNVKLVEDGKFS
ncbi:ATP-dependent RNA helicase TDRD9 [Biomphalaria glabrata]|nr:ATP-dependent RNA helicase TDRD9 [Biomphalaria glabrata]